jgi:predicted phage gp36 major capsid-like protein
MVKTEAKALAGEGASAFPASEVKTALNGFLTAFRGFQDETTLKLKQQEERLTMLDRKMNHAGRPALAATADLDVPHKKAFAAYLRSGDDDGLRGLALEGKGLNTQVNAEGGFLVDPQTSERIRGVLRSTASIRAIANVVSVEATSFDVLVDHTEMGSGWATETGTLAETGSPQIDRIAIPLHELAAMPKASQRLLDDSAFDIEGWLAERIADRFSRAEGQAFVSGDKGSQCDLGLGQPWLCRDRQCGRFRHHQRQRCDRRSGLCAERGISRQCDLRHEFEDRGCGAQDEGCGWPLPVGRRPAGRGARAPDGLSGADFRGHARHRRQCSCACLW